MARERTAGQMEKQTRSNARALRSAMSSVESLAVTVRELRELLPLGKAAAYELARSLGFRVGGRLLVPRAALHALLAGSAGGAGDRDAERAEDPESASGKLARASSRLPGSKGGAR